MIGGLKLSQRWKHTQKSWVSGERSACDRHCDLQNLWSSTLRGSFSAYRGWFVQPNTHWKRFTRSTIPVISSRPNFWLLFKFYLFSERRQRSPEKEHFPPWEQSSKKLRAKTLTYADRCPPEPAGSGKPALQQMTRPKRSGERWTASSEANQIQLQMRNLHICLHPI